MTKGGYSGILLATAVITALALTHPAHAVITHRYSFTGNANDSEGSANWTVNGATFSGGQVNFDGVDDFLSMAATPLPASGSVSIEVWGTYAPGTAPGSRIFDFSNSGNNYLFLTPLSNSNDSRFRWDDGAGLPLGPTLAAPANTGQEVLFTAVYDSAAMTPTGTGEFRLYRDGVLVGSASGENLPILAPIAGSTSNRLGHGTSAGADTPAFLNGSLNEFRTYNNVLNATEILFNAVSGPDVTSVTFTDKTWNAGTSSWNTAGNWTAAGVPANTNRAIIGNGGTATVSAVTPQVGTIRVTNGTITVGAGGTLNSQYPIELMTGASNTATINVNSGGRLAVSGILSDGAEGAKTINVDNGTIAAGFKSALVHGGIVTNVGAGGLTFDTAQGNINWNSSLVGSGNITVSGGGTLTLRPPTIGLGLAEQNPDFSGEVFVNQSTLDLQREHGGAGVAGSTKGGKIHLNNSTLVINTAYPIAPGFRKEIAADLNVTGTNFVVNQVEREATEIRQQGSLSGSGTIRYTKPNLEAALGLDFLNRPNPDLNDTENPILPVDNVNFTGRIIADGNWAIRFFADLVGAEGEQELLDKTDFPNAVFEMTSPFAWLGKRGTSPNQTIRLGGLAGGGSEPLPDTPDILQFTRLQAAIAGPGDPLASLTYELGGANQNVEYAGIIQNGDGDGFWATDIVSLTKVGSNTQTLSGPLTYSGPTTVNGGRLLVNGRHSRDARELAGGAVTPGDAPAISGYAVNAGGTLGGSGFIGSAGNPINVAVNGGKIAPGTSVGTLSVTGNVTMGASAGLDIELMGTTADLLAVTGNLDLSAIGNALNVIDLGKTGTSWTIASYTGSLTGIFESITPGYTVNYGTGTNSQVTLNFVGGGCITGDFNCNGAVENADLTLLLNNWGVAVPPTPTGWTGTAPTAPAIDNDELTALLNNWGNVAGSGSLGANSAVPEPATLALLLFAAALVSFGRGRRR